MEEKEEKQKPWRPKKHPEVKDRPRHIGTAIPESLKTTFDKFVIFSETDRGFKFKYYCEVIEKLDWDKVLLMESCLSLYYRYMMTEFINNKMKERGEIK